MRILFLDVDGVLQTTVVPGFQDMEFVPAVVAELVAARDIRVVVSSTHREGRDLASLREFFPQPLRPFIIGATPDLVCGRAQGGRQRECEAWLQSSTGVSGYLALDDEEFLFDRECPWLVCTHPRDGLFGAPAANFEDWARLPQTGSR